MIPSLLRRALPLVAALAPLAAAERTLLHEGFDAAGEGWSLDGAQGAVDINRYLRLTVDVPDRQVLLYREVPVAGAEAVRLALRLRWSGVKRGAKPWFDARLMLEFRDAKGAKLAGAPPPPFFTGSSDGWQKRELAFAVPPGATVLTIMPALFQAKAGSFDLDDLVVERIPASALAATPAKTRPAVPLPALDGGRPAPPALKVAGNRLVDPQGQEVWLQGASVDSLQWSNTGEDILASVAAAIEQWHANVVRLPMMANRWFGKDPGQNDGGKAYRELIAQAVQVANSRGAWLILDLHRFRAPDEQDLAFWKEAAAAYKDHPGVIFELFNEPHDISWEVWRNGGEVADKVKDPAVLAENKDAMVRFRTTGIQALVDAVRAAGARNLILAGALDWSYDLSGILTGFALDDRGGNGIAYVTHVYPWKSGWQHAFLDVAKVHPLVVTEVGCDAVRYDFIPASRFEDPYGWAGDMIACIQQHRLNWTAFSFHPNCGPPMLAAKGSYEPTPFWGSFVRAALLGQGFQPGRHR